MKKLLSVLLLLSIFLTPIQILTSAASVLMPDGTTMNSGSSTSANTGYTAISDAEGFKGITTGGKYYLTANIDLTASGVNFKPIAGGNNEAKNFILDGCGYTVTTNKPLFEELPGNSGTSGSHSQIRNLVIKGTISVTSAEITAYNNGVSVGALAGKANGARLTNIVNNASVTVTDTTDVQVRVGGIIGSVFNDDLIVKNCVNNGAIKACVSGSTDYGIGGIVGFVANNASGLKTTFENCMNKGTITNTSKATSNTFAGAIFGTKRTASIISIKGCTNYGTVSSSLYYGKGVFQSLYSNKAFTGITLDASPIATAADFKKIVAGGKYYLTANIDLTAPGVNFTTLAGGENSAAWLAIDGLGYTVTTNKPLIAQLPGGSSVVGIHSDIRNLTVNGNVTVTDAEITALNNGTSAGVVVGKANGGTFSNITNNANITITSSDNVNIRVGGIIGSVFNDSLTMKNCVNNGNISGRVGNANDIYAMGGIIGYVANDADGLKTVFTDCRNTGKVTNTSTATTKVYAGAIFGNKRANGVIQMSNCSNTGAVTSKVYCGKDVYQALYSTKSLTGVTANDITAISTAAQFKTITAGGKYYLTANIDLTASGVNFTTLAGGGNTSSVIILDGCGYTVTTNKPLFKELLGGGAGKHSEISDLNINGAIALSASDASTYSNTVGALACKANGGIFKNVVNNATLTLTSEASASVAGLVGSVVSEAATFENCINKGEVKANVVNNNGTASAAGIVGFVGVNGVSFLNCSNTANITNISEKASGAYAGGIIGTKQTADTVLTMRDCSNSGKVRAKTAYGNYYAVSTYKKAEVIKIIPISTAEEFAKISGNGEYKLTANITLTNTNTNSFSGVLYGNGFTVTAKGALFKNGSSAKLNDVNLNILSLNINGRPLDTFAVIAATASDASATAIVNHVKTKYGITLPIKTPTNNYTGNAIYINLGNTYGGARYGLDYGVNAKGYFEIYLDETSAKISTFVSDFLKNKLTTDKQSYDFFNDFGDKSFRYELGSVKNQGFTFNPSQDVSRTLIDGVTYIQRTYTNSSGVKVKAYITVMEADAKAHIEVKAAPLTKVSSCENNYSENCLNIHGLSPKSTSAFVAEMEAEGKNVLAATNGGFFMKSAGCYAPWGLQVINGRVDAEPRDDTSDTKKYSNWFAITKDGKPVIGDLATYESTYKGQLLYGVGARDILLRNEKYLSPSGAHDARTAVGYNAKGDIVLFTVPGNDENETNPGATLADLAQIFMDLDMDITNAMSLDGGGSTTMVVEAENGQPKLESPLYSTTEERALGNILAIVAN